MPELREMAIYGILALAVVVVVIYLVSGTQIFGSRSYSVNVSLSQSGASPTYPYQTSYYTINVTNTGHSQVNGLLVGFYLNGQPQNTTTVSLPAGKSIEIQRNYTYPSSGSYEFEAIADPGRLLNIADRQSAQSTMSINITNAELPNVYTSIPNGNITSTQSFTLNENGDIESAAIAQRYNISIMNRLFGPAEPVALKIFENVYPFTAKVYGAYAKYSDNSIAYTAWIQGTLNPQVVDVVISSFGYKVHALNGSAESMAYSEIDNKTSICTFYSNGWTKIISYYNNSAPMNCMGIAGKIYVPSESVVLTNLVKNNTKLAHYQSGFFYTNSSVIGSSLSYSGSNVTATNLFENNYGVFVSSIKKLSAGINVSSFTNSTCYGLIFNMSNVSICSYIIPTRTGNVTLPYGLVNSSYITSNYIINMYSLVNNTQLVAAHDNAANLMSRLNVSSRSMIWNTIFKDTCAFDNQSIGCTFVKFISKNNTAYFNITNKLPANLRINKLNCEIAPGFANLTVNQTIGPNQSREFVQMCNMIAIPAAAAQRSFILLLNYTYGNSTVIAHGALNITTQTG
ncbi:MAG: hypothetical protein KGI06_05355 [Candidatus Micrarchaeota archaeon]|nr:hypothetical protein [Candidatus Micrarchaeota archaeon]